METRAKALERSYGHGGQSNDGEMQAVQQGDQAVHEVRIRQFPLENTPRPMHKGNQEEEVVNPVGKPPSLSTLLFLKRINASCM